MLPKYAEFLEAFPTVFDLAKATPAAVLRVWKGMGYNRRALYLQKAARLIVEHSSSVIPAHAGIRRKNINISDRIEFPKSEKELCKLPGLGIYTARAILVFAYKQEVPLVDTNIRQIITHFFFARQAQGPALKGLKDRALEKEIEDVARQLIPAGKSWEWHQALMDYGALALNVSRLTSHVSRKKAVPFKDSNRFFRGRIIDRLREERVSEQLLLNELIDRYGKPEAFFRSIIVSLLTDSLIERTPRGVLHLPGE